MRFRSPRFRYNTALLGAAAFLLFVGTVFHRQAFRRQVSALDLRLSALSKRLDSLPSSPVSSGHSSPVPSSASAPASTSGVTMRLLGSGRTGNWFYNDVRQPDGVVRRYYLRRDADRDQVRRYYLSIIADREDSLRSLTSMQTVAP